MTEFTENIITISLSGLFGIICATIASFVNYRINIKNKNNANQNKQLIQAYKDIISFRELEDMYATVISNASGDTSTPLAVMKRYRSMQRKNGKESPSDKSSILYCQKEIKKLS
jgi:L-serine deaminase